MVNLDKVDKPDSFPAMERPNDEPISRLRKLAAALFGLGSEERQATQFREQQRMRTEQDVASKMFASALASQRGKE